MANGWARIVTQHGRMGAVAHDNTRDTLCSGRGVGDAARCVTVTHIVASIVSWHVTHGAVHGRARAG